MHREKLALENLKVQSFVTHFEDPQKQDVKGGSYPTNKSCLACWFSYFNRLACN